MYRGRGSNTVDRYLLGGRTLPWYAMGLSIMATQASAITFISTTSQAYVDGMRFVQFYFGLPLAMVILSATAVPIFHRARVYTAYEYLEQRFDMKTRALVSVVFLIQRGLAAGSGALRARGSAFGRAGLAGLRYDDHHGSADRYIHHDRRFESVDLGRRSTDGRDPGRFGGLPDSCVSSNAQRHFSSGRLTPGWRGEEIESRRFPRSI